MSDVYSCDPRTSVWRRSQAKEFAYTDGDAVEQRIRRIVSECEDPGIFSPEMAQAVTDWPSLYHLGRARLNLLWPFIGIFSGKTLEIGCGCGAITRALGEFGGEVLALEGSAVRAEIAASRCRGLENVRVVHDSFDCFEHEDRFDVVTLIGVLEYARIYFRGNPDADPVAEMLTRARSFLKPGGILLLAIENQLGLKYLAGSPEDHNGIPMFGVEDHYGERDVVTFGEDELRQLLKNGGLGEQQWWYPFPDYKFPVSIFSEDGVKSRACDLTPLLQNAVLTDPQRAATSFSLESAWSPVYRNGLAGALANSFVTLASDRPLPKSVGKVLAYHYAGSRREAFAKQVVFLANEDGGVTVRHEPLFQGKQDAVPEAFSIVFEETGFVSGRHWQRELIRILNRPGWTLKMLQEWASNWFKAFVSYAQLGELSDLSKHTELAGDYFDAVPRNLIIQSDGKGVFFDQEWHLARPCTLGFIVFRSLGLSFFGVTSIAEPEDGISLRVQENLFLLARSIGIELDADDLPSYVSQENDLQALVTGAATGSLSVDLFESWSLDVRRSLWNPDTRSQLEAEILRKDRDLALLAAEIHRLESAVLEKADQLQSVSEELRAYHTLLPGKEQALVLQASEIHRLEAHARLQEQSLQELGEERSRLQADLAAKDAALQELAAETQRLACVIAEKLGALALQADEIHRLEAHASDKQAVIGELSALLLARNEQIEQKDLLCTAQAAQIEALQASLYEKETLMQQQTDEMNARIDALTADLATMTEKMGEERNYFYAEVAKRDHLLADASERLDQIRAELASTSTELQALRQTRWFRLREVLLFHPLSARKILHLGCIVAGALMPRGFRAALKPRVKRIPGFAAPQGSAAGNDSGAYQVKLPSAPPVHAPKIVHVIANFMTGGSSRLVVDLIEHLGDRYHQCVLTSFNPQPPAYLGIEIEECRFPDSAEPFIEYYKKVQPDFVHVHYWGDCDEPWYAKAIEAAGALGLPVIENINTPIVPYRADAVVKYVYVSDYVRSVFGEPDARHVTVYPGSNFNLFARSKKEHAPENCVGMVYRLERDKLNEEAIQPFIRIAQLRPQTKILIVGGGSLLEPFQAAVQAAGVTENFEFTGYVSYDVLPGLYRRMSLFVAPVWKESFGQVSPFAMSMKVPVIGYEIGAIPEIIGTSELVAPAADAECLARIAIELLDAPAKRQALGEAQQQRAQARFSIQAMIDHYAQLYAEIAQHTRKETV